MTALGAYDIEPRDGMVAFRELLIVQKATARVLPSLQAYTSQLSQADNDHRQVSTKTEINL